MTEQGPVTRAEKAEELLRWAIEWIEYAGVVPWMEEAIEKKHWEKYEAAKVLLK